MKEMKSRGRRGSAEQRDGWFEVNSLLCLGYIHFEHSLCGGMKKPPPPTLPNKNRTFEHVLNPPPSIKNKTWFPNPLAKLEGSLQEDNNFEYQRERREAASGVKKGREGDRERKKKTRGL
jgi:hypothetical protein